MAALQIHFFATCFAAISALFFLIIAFTIYFENLHTSSLISQAGSNLCSIPDRCSRYKQNETLACPFLWLKAGCYFTDGGHAVEQTLLQSVGKGYLVQYPSIALGVFSASIIASSVHSIFVMYDQVLWRRDSTKNMRQTMAIHVMLLIVAAVGAVCLGLACFVLPQVDAGQYEVAAFLNWTYVDARVVLEHEAPELIAAFPSSQAIMGAIGNAQGLLSACATTLACISAVCCCIALAARGRLPRPRVSERNDIVRRYALPLQDRDDWDAVVADTRDAIADIQVELDCISAEIDSGQTDDGQVSGLR